MGVNANGVCNVDTCEIGTCLDGYADCDNSGDSCESALSANATCGVTCDDPSTLYCDQQCLDIMENDEHCGGCGITCDLAEPYCRGGECTHCSDGVAAEWVSMPLGDGTLRVARDGSEEEEVPGPETDHGPVPGNDDGRGGGRCWNFFSSS